MSKGAKGLVMELAAEQNLADQLFADGADEPVKLKPVSLNSQDEYKSFGEETGKILYAGKAPYRIEDFFKSIGKDLPEHAEAK